MEPFKRMGFFFLLALLSGPLVFAGERELKTQVNDSTFRFPRSDLNADNLWYSSKTNLKNDPKKNGENLWTHLRSNIKNYERDVIIAALKRYRGNKSRASKELGISRSILYRKMKILDLSDQDLF